MAELLWDVASFNACDSKQGHLSTFFSFWVFFLFGCLVGFCSFFLILKVCGWGFCTYSQKLCCIHPQRLFWNALLYSFAFNITGWSLVEPHLVKSLWLSQAFCHHPKVFPSSCAWCFFSIPLWLLTREVCFENCFFSRPWWGHIPWSQCISDDCAFSTEGER